MLLPVVSLLPPGLLSRTIARTASSKLIGFCSFLFFPYLFVSVPCARLSSMVINIGPYNILANNWFILVVQPYKLQSE